MFDTQYRMDYKLSIMNAAQLRMARAALRWKVSDLSAATGVHANTISAIEDGRTDPRASTLEMLVRVYQEAGIRFTEYGVEFPPPQRKGVGASLLLGISPEEVETKERVWSALTGKKPPK